MTDSETTNEPGRVQADDNSMAVGGNIDIKNVQSSNIHIGNIIYNTPQAPELSDLNETEHFEPETVYVAEGKFQMGNSPGEKVPGYEMPLHEVTLPEYRLSRRPVSNVQYEEFIQQTNKSAPKGWLSRRAPEGREDAPVTGVTWFDALEYCTWLSKTTGRQYSLPNEAQLEKAYKGSYEIADPVDNVPQWTCTLWGERVDAPDRRFGAPWKDDGRNNVNANRQIRRVVCVYRKREDAPAPRLSKRFGELPGEAGLPGARYGFRVVITM